jgi:hypothetical protein
MIKRTVLLLLVLALLAPVEMAWSRNDHLEPAPGPVFLSAPKSLFMEAEPPGTEVYFDTLLKIILEGFGASSQIYHVVTPPFSGEYAWSAECGEDGECFLLVHRMAKNFWYRKSPEMTRQRIAIAKPLYDSLKELFAEATARIYPDRGVVVIDGTGYYFMYGDAGGNLRVGFTDSPDPGSLMNRLTVICEKVMSLHADVALSEREIQVAIREIVKEIQAQPSARQGILWGITGY